MKRNTPIPTPPLGPAEQCKEDGFSCSTYREHLSPEHALASERAYELYQEASESADPRQSRAKLEQSLQLDLHSKTAERLSSCLNEQGEYFSALTMAALGYALNPRMDKPAIHFASLLHQHGESQRAWEIVAETLTRNNSFGPAWTLFEKMEIQR